MMNANSSDSFRNNVKLVGAYRNSVDALPTRDNTEMTEQSFGNYFAAQGDKRPEIDLKTLYTKKASKNYSKFLT